MGAGLGRAGTLGWTAVAMVAFAGNSILCRAALSPGAGDEGGAIDPVAFTGVRVAAGAAVLAPVLLVGASGTGVRSGGGRMRSVALGGAALLTYALGFSLSYATLPAGVGALILFGCVQLTMLGAARLQRERIGARRWIGAGIAFGGLVVLVTPSLGKAGAADSLGPVDPRGAALMALAGVAWGAYTLLGRGAPDPTRATARNFAAALVAVAPIAAGVALSGGLRADGTGLALAVASGALCSGLGYAIWYRALRGHTAASAAVAQLTVPVLAALLGALLLGEPLTLAWAAASAMVIVGVAMGLERK